MFNPPQYIGGQVRQKAAADKKAQAGKREGFEAAYGMMVLQEIARQEDSAVLHEQIQRLPQEAFDDRSELKHDSE